MAGHELFGHGSGRLVYRDKKTGKCPITAVAPINPKKEINSCYEEGETYSSKFGDIGTSFEECRADLSGLWLQQYPEMYELFGWTANENKILRWSSLMAEARKGILGLDSSYNELKDKWNQAHTQGAYVITQYIMQNSKNKIIEVKLQKNMHGKSDFYIKINREHLDEATQLIGKMLSSFQVWKSLGAIDEAKAFYAKYSKVGSFELKLKHLMHSLPRGQAIRLFQNIERHTPNTVKFDSGRYDGNIVPTLRNYQRNFIGVIKSYVDRYPFSVALYNQIIGEWNKTKRFLKVPKSELSQTLSDVGLDDSLLMTKESKHKKKHHKKIGRKHHHSKK